MHHPALICGEINEALLNGVRSSNGWAINRSVRRNERSNKSGLILPKHNKVQIEIGQYLNNFDGFISIFLVHFIVSAIRVTGTAGIQYTL